MSVLRHVTEDRHVAHCPCGWWGTERASEQEAARDVSAHDDECEESECP